MPMDAAVFAALAQEATEHLLEARLEKLLPVNPRELLLLLRAPAVAGNRSEFTLTLSLDGPLSRVLFEPALDRLSTHREQPVPFVLLLRRHLLGSRLSEVYHQPWERLLHLTFLGPADEFPRRRHTLVYELLGAQGNLLLLDAHNVVLGSLRPLPAAIQGTSPRLVLGAPYAPPAAPPAVPGAPLGYLQRALTLALPDTSLRQALLRNVGGLGPWAAKVLCAAAGLDSDAPCGALTDEDLTRLHSALDDFAGAVAGGHFTPTVWRDGGRPVEFWVRPAPSVGTWVPEPQSTVCAAIRTFFAERVETARLGADRHRLQQRLDAQVSRVERRLQAQHQDLARAEQAEALRLSGELLLANLPRVTRGATSFTGSAYGDPTLRTVVLDPRLTASENAQRYFARYRKAKRGYTEAAARLAATSSLLEQLRIARLELRDADDLGELRAAESLWVADGLLEPERRAGAASRKPVAARPAPSVRPSPRRYRTVEGYEVLAGRNSRENDWLTLKTGAPHDLWFHVKDLPGAHVILRRPTDAPVPDEDLREAALIAAYHSEGRESSQVPVDYTERRHVRKAPGGGPGQVLYDHHHTLYVTPETVVLRRVTTPLPAPPDS